MNNNDLGTRGLLWMCIMALMFGVSSCSSTMKCTVYGSPGTEIYYPNGNYIATIPPMGKCKIKLERSRTDLLLTRQSEGSPMIPMGLDYNRRKNIWFVETMNALFIVPTVCLSTLAYLDYVDKGDVACEVALRSRQQVNSDLNNLVTASSNPIDEIRNMMQLYNEQPKISKSPSRDDSDKQISKSDPDKQKWISDNNIEAIEEYCRQKLFFTYGTYTIPIDNDRAGDVINLLIHGAKQKDANCLFMLGCVLSGNKTLRYIDENGDTLSVPTSDDYKYMDDKLAKAAFTTYFDNFEKNKDWTPFGLSYEDIKEMIKNAYPSLMLLIEMNDLLNAAIPE